MSEQIKRAIKYFKFNLENKEVWLFDVERANFETALKCLQSEFERQENKALTLSELKEMVGEPVYVVPKDYMVNVPIKAIVIMTIFDDENNSMNNYVRSDKGDIFYIEHNIFCKHKPTEGVGR